MSTQVFILSSRQLMATVASSSFSSGNSRGTSGGQTARLRNNSSRDRYRGMCLAMSNTGTGRSGNRNEYVTEWSLKTYDQMPIFLHHSLSYVQHREDMVTLEGINFVKIGADAEAVAVCSKRSHSGTSQKGQIQNMSMPYGNGPTWQRLEVHINIHIRRSY